MLGSVFRPGFFQLPLDPKVRKTLSDTPGAPESILAFFYVLTCDYLSSSNTERR